MSVQTTEPGILQVSEQDFERRAALVNEPGWLLQRRMAAWRAWERLPLPDAQTQLAWRRTDPARLRLEDVSLPDWAAEPGQSTLAPLDQDCEFAAVLHLVDGHPMRTSIRRDLLERGVRVLPFAEALQEIPGVLERAFMTEAVRFDEGKFQALHAAFCREGAIIHIPRGVEVDVPIYVAQELTKGSVVAFPHLLIYAEEESNVAVIHESYSQATGHALVAPIVEVVALGGAKVQYVDLQRLGKDVVVLPQIRAVNGRDATTRLATIGLGGGVVKGGLGCRLAEPGGTSDLLGLQFTDDAQHYDLDTLQLHVAGYTTSRLLFKTALRGRSTVIGNGLVRIEHGAQKSDAYQENRNLLLSDHARADPIPGLEILANDVRCSHGTTVGPIDPDQRFYLQCRGLAVRDADHLIVRGFFQSVIDEIPSVVRERLDAEIEAKILSSEDGSP